jgi:HPr kinase/phosphorylase
MASLRLKDILQGREGDLGLAHMTGEAGLARSIVSIRVERFENAGGFRRRVIPGVVPVVTRQHVSELTSVRSLSRKKILRSIISNRIPLIAISETDIVPDFIASFSELNGIPVLASVYDGFLLESRLAGLFREKLEHSVSMHGTLVSISGLGVMLAGESGAGKTECALKLTERGHRLVADDAVEVDRRGDLLYGRCHELVKGLINIKQRGIVEAEELLGAHAILNDSVINLMVEFYNERSPRGVRAEKLSDVLGVKLPCVELPGFPQTTNSWRYVELEVRKIMSARKRGDS